MGDTAPPGHAEKTGCQVTELFRLLGRAHVLDVLYVVIEESEAPVRFVELQRRLKLSPNTLSDRLDRLVKAGLLTRTAYNEIPPRVDYAATDKARDLHDVFRSLDQWARKHDLEPQPAADAAAATA